MLFLLQNYSPLGGLHGYNQGFHSFLLVSPLILTRAELCGRDHISYSVHYCHKTPNEKQLKGGRKGLLGFTDHHGREGMTEGAEGSRSHKEGMDERWFSAFMT